MRAHSSTTRRTILPVSIACFVLALSHVAHAGDRTWRDIGIDRTPAGYRVGEQGDDSVDCLGWASLGVLRAEPPHPARRILPSAGEIYREASALVPSKRQPVEVVHAGKALVTMNLIDGYRLVKTPHDIWNWLRTKGPVVGAIYWDEMMMSQQGSGLRPLSVSSKTWEHSQAHAITILGWVPERHAFLITPNLGPHWGDRGFALLRETDFPYIFVSAMGFEHGNPLAAGRVAPAPEVTPAPAFWIAEGEYRARTEPAGKKPRPEISVVRARPLARSGRKR